MMKVNEIMWAWFDEYDKSIWHIYPTKKCVEMCSPDGFKESTKRGYGRIIKVKITEVK